jgi:poly(hydroxyalkanoate) depolymerase family esterase
MRTRLLDAINDALAHVKTSNLAEAAALLRKALPGGDAIGRPAAGGPHPSAFAFAPPSRAPLGEVLRALRAGRAHLPKAPFTPEDAPDPHDDNFTARNYRGPAGSLDYRLYVPAGRETRELALLLMLHGCTQTPEDFARGTRMNRVADEYGLVVAYPHQPHAANASRCWNWFDRGHQQRGSGEPAKLAGLAQSLADEFGIGRERTFVAGLSAGGAMAEVLAATYPDVFAAVGIHSGLPYRAASDVPSAFAAMKGAPAAAARRAAGPSVRKIVFHGAADATVAPVNAERILEQARSGGERWQQVELASEVEGRRVDRTILRNSDGDAVVELWTVEGGGHAWFGGDSRGSYAESVGPDASRSMARFFLQR